MNQPFRRADESELINSILKEAQEDWLEKKVRNPATGNEVKVKSLPPEEQEKYRPKKQEGIEKKKEEVKSKLHGLKKDHIEEAHGSKIFDHATDKDGTHTWTYRHESTGGDPEDDDVYYRLHPADKNGEHILEADDSRGDPHILKKKIKNHDDLKSALSMHPNDDDDWAGEMKDMDEFNETWDKHEGKN